MSKNYVVDYKVHNPMEISGTYAMKLNASKLGGKEPTNKMLNHIAESELDKYFAVYNYTILNIKEED